MTEYLRTLCKTGIGLFVLWHMAAIGIYALPTAANDPLSAWVREHGRDVVTPYVQLTSQWQQWNLFSPDPLRRITRYRVTTDDTDMLIDDATYNGFRHAVRFKLYDQALRDAPALQPLHIAAARMLCTELKIAVGTPMAIWSETAVLPTARDRSAWEQWQPTFDPLLLLRTSCP